MPVPRSHSALLLSPGSVGLLLSIGSAVLPTLAHVLQLTLDQAVLFLILVAVDLRTLAAVVLLHTLTVVGPLVSLATRVVLVAVAATLHAMATVIAGGTGTGEVMHITGTAAAAIPIRIATATNLQLQPKQARSGLLGRLRSPKARW